MSERVKYLTPFVITLRDLSPRKQKQLMSCCNGQHIRAFQEVALNLVKGTVELTPDQLKICQKWHKPIKVLARKDYSLKDKKRLLVQKGGFLGAILPIIASVLGSVLSS